MNRIPGKCWKLRNFFIKHTESCYFTRPVQVFKSDIMFLDIWHCTQRYRSNTVHMIKFSEQKVKCYHIYVKQTTWKIE